jgi:hypothetical protein
MGDDNKSKYLEISEGTVQTLSSMIPEVYFDLISRVPPGVLLVLGIAYSIRPTLLQDIAPQQTTSGIHEPPYIVLLLLLLGAGYAVGIMLTAFGSIFLKMYGSMQFIKIANSFSTELRDWIWQLTFTEQPPTSWDSLNKEQCINLYRRLHDHIKSKNRDAARILPKMSAEARLCENTAAACFVFVVLFPIIRLFRFHEFHQFWLLLLLLLGFFCSWFAAIHRNDSFLRRQFSLAEDVRLSQSALPSN